MFGRKKRSLSDFDSEIQAHIDFEAEELREDGLGEEEARYAALRQFGNVTIARERFYEAGRWLWLDALVRNLCFAFRLMRRQPVSMLAIILLLALGFGGVMAVYNPINSMLFTPLPLPEPEQLVRIGGDIRLFSVPYSRFEKEEELKRIFSSIAAYVPDTSLNRFRIPETGKVKEIYSLKVTEEFFETLGVKPFMGYGFSNKEHRDGAIISYRFWNDELMRSDNAIGNQIFRGITPLTVVGIMPEGFNFPIDTDIWLCSNGKIMIPFEGTQFIGRLRSGIPIYQAADALRTIDFDQSITIVGNSGPVLQSLQTFLYGVQYPLVRLLGVVSILFLLLVCAGAVNILFVQNSRRKTEMTMRLIFSAPRRNLFFQLLVEKLLLVVPGGFLGWCFSIIAGAWLGTQFPALQVNAENLPMKIVFWIVLALIVTILAGLVPSLYATNINLNTYLKSATTGNRRFIFSQEFLVGVQLGVALALLIGMGVMLRGMMHRVDFPIGWSSRDTVVVSAYPLENTLILNNETRPRLAMSFQNVLRELRALPEVVSVGYLSPIPFTAEAVLRSGVPTPTMKTLPTDGSRAIPDDTPAFNEVRVDSNGFDILGIPLVLGRLFTKEDGDKQINRGRDFYGTIQGAAIINQAMAQRFWPGENPIGMIFYDNGFIGYEVVGVVRNYHQTSEKMIFRRRFFIRFQEGHRIINCL